MPSLQGKNAFSSTTHNQMNSNHATNGNTGGGNKKMGLYGRTGLDYNMMRFIPGVRINQGHLQCCTLMEYSIPNIGYRAPGTRRPRFPGMNPMY